MTNLTTQRLHIEPLRASHADMVWSGLQDTAIYTYIPDDPPAATDLQRRYQFLEKGSSPDGEELWLNWTVFLRDTMTPIGTFQATLPNGKPGSFAYIVFPQFWRQGYAKEMAISVLNHLFEAYPVPSLFAEIDTRNIPSIRLVESLGLIRVATIKDADVFKGSSSDEYKYSISRTTWSKTKCFSG